MFKGGAQTAPYHRRTVLCALCSLSQFPHCAMAEFGKQRTDLPKPGELLHLDFRTKSEGMTAASEGIGAGRPIKLLQVSLRHIYQYLRFGCEQTNKDILPLVFCRARSLHLRSAETPEQPVCCTMSPCVVYSFRLCYNARAFRPASRNLPH